MNSHITSQRITGEKLIATAFDRALAGKRTGAFIVSGRLCVTSGISRRFFRKTPGPSIYQATEHLSFSPSIEIHEIKEAA